MVKKASQNLEPVVNEELLDYIQVWYFCNNITAGAIPIVIPDRCSHQGRLTHNLVHTQSLAN